MTNNSSSTMEVPQAKDAMDKFKMEAASEVGVNLKPVPRQVPSVVKWFEE